jgi:hypothetical protein
MHLHRRERYCVGQESANVGHLFVQATKFCTVAPCIVSVSLFFFPDTQKGVLVAFTKRKVPDDSGGLHATTELWVLTTELHDTFLTPRNLKWLLDILEVF